MKLYAMRDYEEMSKKAAEFVISLVKNKPDGVLGLATGSTPVGLYKKMVEDHKENGTSYKQIRTFNLDEYIGLEGSHPQSYRYFMNEQLFNHLDIPMENTHVPNGKAADLAEECRNYEQMIKDAGGIDLQILGIGTNGHIGFNEPGTSFESRTHVTELVESTRTANARFFDSMDEVPTHAITTGIQSILESRQIILLISGESKTEPMKRLLTEEISEDFPASALKRHDNVIVIADEAALKDVDFNEVKNVEVVR